MPIKPITFTEDELRRLDAINRQTQAPKTGPLDGGLLSSAGEFLKGAGKGLTSTLKETSGLGEKTVQALGRIVTPKSLESKFGFEKTDQTSAEGLQSTIENKLGVQQGALTTPMNNLQSLGFGAEQIAEFFLPGGAIKTGTKAIATGLKGAGIGSKFAGLGGRALAEGISSTAIRTAQTGSPIEGLKAGALDVGVVGGLGVLGQGVSALTKGKGFIPKSAEGVADSAGRVGVQLPASALTDSNIVNTAEKTISRGLFSKPLTKSIEEATTGIRKFADDIVQKAGNVRDPSDLGRVITDGLGSFRKEFQRTKSKLYSNVPNLSAVSVAPSKTIAILQSKVDDLGRTAGLISSPEKKFFTKLLDGLQANKAPARGAGGGVTPGVDADTIRSVIQQLNKKAGNFADTTVPADKGFIRKITATLSEEMDEALIAQRPEIAEALNKANAFFKQGNQTLQNSLSKSINRLTDKPDKIFDIIARPSTSVEDLKRIMEFAGEGADDIRASFLSRSIEKASDEAGAIKGSVIDRLLKAYGPEKLNAILKPDQIKALEDLATVSKALNKSVKLNAGSTGLFQRGILEIFGAFINPILGLQIILGDAAISKFLTSPSGKKILQEGLLLKGGTGKAIESAAPAVGRILAPTLTPQDQPNR